MFPMMQIRIWKYKISKVFFYGSRLITLRDAYVSPLGDIVVPPTLGLAAASYIQQTLQYYGCIGPQ